MFGLPWETTFIMGGGILFWVTYTLVFYFRTRKWTVEDADYDQPADLLEGETRS